MVNEPSFLEMVFYTVLACIAIMVWGLFLLFITTSLIERLICWIKGKTYLQ